MTLINNLKLSSRMDSGIRFFLYVLFFWLPYSPAVVEVCVIGGFILWVCKRVVAGSVYLHWPFEIRDFTKIIKAFQLPSSVLSKPIFVFLAVCFISAIGSSFTEIALRGLLTKTLEWFVIYFLIVEVFKTEFHLKWAFRVLIFTGVAVCLDALLQYHFLGQDVFCGRDVASGGATGPFKHPNSLGAFLIILMPIIWALVLTPKSKGREYFFFLSIGLLSLWCALITFSRGTWVGMIAAIIYLFVKIKPRILPWIVIALLVVALVLGVFLNADMKDFLRISSEKFMTTFQWRKNIWLESFALIKDKPLMGHGLNTFMRLFQSYRSKHVFLNDFQPTYAHNCYLQLTAEVGLLGFLSFGWILCSFFRNTCCSFRFNSKDHTERLKILLVAFKAGVVGFLVQSFFDVNFYSLQLVALFWVVVGLAISLWNILSAKNICVKR